LNRDLYYAIQREELQVYFQPQVRLDGEVSGFEALLRWQHPSRGAVPPTDFVPLAEKSGLIVTIGEWVMRRACLQCKEWQSYDRGTPTVAVNVSAIQFEERNFAERVAEILRETGLDPSLLTIELTETVLLKDVKLANEHLTKLRSAGVGIALDDFGTGYCSLSYLQALPADTIKLDRSFVVRALSERPAMLESIIGMAHGIGMRVIAEGIETERQRKCLEDLACDQIQGFLYSRPMPAERVADFLESHAEMLSLIA
jgi:EAL domain-containing protein (putative c-di-GMP-specific phosphodiesterase class I)